MVQSRRLEVAGVRALPAGVGTGRPKFSSAALCQSPVDRGVHVGPQMDLL